MQQSSSMHKSTNAKYVWIIISTISLVFLLMPFSNSLVPAFTLSPPTPKPVAYAYEEE